MSAGKILVVDDEADIRRLLQEILSEEGHDVDVAADAAQARAARARSAPDLVLLDIWMPDTDGITLLREWSNDARNDCPVVMMSGHGTVETAVEATRLGAFDFIEKPLSLAKLLPTVKRALDARRTRQFGDYAAARTWFLRSLALDYYNNPIATKYLLPDTNNNDPPDKMRQIEYALHKTLKTLTN